MAAKKTVGVCLTPVLIDQFDVSKSIVVVIDVLRATTSMCAGIHNGVHSITPVADVDECRKYRDKGYIIAAERNGAKIKDFDMGNSPYEYMSLKLKGKKIAMTTTNGTFALHEAVRLGARKVVIGSFANFNKLVKWLKERNENVILLCAAYKGQPNLEDTIFAGNMVRRLRGQFELFEDSSLIAETLSRSANRRKRFFIRNSSHFNRLNNILQIQKDVKYSLRRDTHPVIPVLHGKVIVELDGETHQQLKAKEGKKAEKKSENGGKKSSKKKKAEKVK